MPILRLEQKLLIYEEITEVPAGCKLLFAQKLHEYGEN